MNARSLARTFATLVAGAALSVAGARADDTARRKEGASRGGRSGAAADRHPSSRSGGEARSGGGERSAPSAQSNRTRERSSARDSGASATRRVEGAEARHPEAGTGHGWRVGRNGYYWSRPYYSRSSRPYYWYRPYYWGYYGVPYYDYYWSAWDYPYWSAGYAYRDRYRYRETAAIRTLVDPEKTKVFVDGYYAGTADDFDGLFQRLHVAPGRHDISFELEGYRTHRVKVYALEDRTIKIRHEMRRGAGDESLEDLTDGREDPPYRRGAAERDPRERDLDDAEREPGDRGRADSEGRERERGEPGTLRVEVRPEDASIYVDGQFFGTSRRSEALTLPPGRHRIEVVRPGYRTVEREVEIRPGRSESIAIDLERG